MFSGHESLRDLKERRKMSCYWSKNELKDTRNASNRLILIKMTFVFSFDDRLTRESFLTVKKNSFLQATNSNGRIMLLLLLPFVFLSSCVVPFNSSFIFLMIFETFFLRHPLDRSRIFLDSLAYTKGITYLHHDYRLYRLERQRGNDRTSENEITRLPNERWIDKILSRFFNIFIIRIHWMFSLSLSLYLQ